MGEKYFITTYDVQTKLYTKLQENWIEMRLRYVVKPRQRRAISHLLISNILEALEKEEDIMVGTAVGIDLMNAADKKIIRMLSSLSSHQFFPKI
ncbi:hypothetical protein [Methanosarcina horonobensis]|uniref:hypothetical protein n=1 Tax=Methanosarcina horonobensis TaxID=418008 RepID=UPI000B2C11BA|nr:hypothetical protein [Methanosarcina horonobensis]